MNRKSEMQKTMHHFFTLKASIVTAQPRSNSTSATAQMKPRKRPIKRKMDSLKGNEPNDEEIKHKALWQAFGFKANCTHPNLKSEKGEKPKDGVLEANTAKDDGVLKEIYLHNILDEQQASPVPVTNLVLAREKCDLDSTAEVPEEQQEVDSKEVAEEEESEEKIDYGQEREGISQFEKLRLEKIARNQAFLQSIGIGTNLKGAIPHPTATKPKSARKKNRKCAEQDKDATKPLVPVRRSSRKRGRMPESYHEDAQLEARPPSEEEPEEEINYDDSSVIKYLCAATSQEGLGLKSEENSIQKGALKGLQVSGDTLSADKLTAIYSLHTNPFASLVSAGGKGGVVAVFSTDKQQEKESELEAHEDDQDEDEDEAVLLNYKAHQSWISGVLFLEESINPNGNLLLSAGNDGLIKMWDISKQHKGMPKIEWTTNQIHDKGIFSMHNHGEYIATGSKDKSVAISAIRETGHLERVSRFPTCHAGVVKCVDMRDSHVLASSGDDCNVVVHDRRNSAGPLCQLQDVHARSVHSVKWSPTEPQYLITAGLDPFIHLYDLRQPSKPVFSYRGHSSSLVKKHKVIHRPQFHLDGHSIITGGESSFAISIYDVKSGSTISRGSLPNDIVTVVPYSKRHNVDTTIGSLSSGEVIFLKSIYK